MPQTINARRRGGRLRAAAAAVILVCVRAPGARAAFDVPMFTPQASAMGGASLAAEADSAALFVNAAGGARLSGAEGYFMYNQPYAGLPGASGLGQGLLSVGVPTKLGTIGVGIGDFQAAGLMEERAVGLGWARRLFDDVDGGVALKYLNQNYLVGSDPAASDPVFQHGTARGAFALDAGIIARLSDSWSAGLSARNLNEPDLGLAGVDRVPREFQAGLACRIESWALRLTLDDEYRDVPSGSFSDRNRPAVGLEKRLVDDRIRFRVGADPDRFSGGVGVRFGGMTLDYAFILARGLLANNAGTHQVGLRWRFGEPALSRSSDQ